VPQLLQTLFGKVFGDKGCLSKKLSQQLLKTLGVQLITTFRRNMKNRLTALEDPLAAEKAHQRRNHHRPAQEYLSGCSR